MDPTPPQTRAWQCVSDDVDLHGGGGVGPPGPLAPSLSPCAPLTDDDDDDVGAGRCSPFGCGDMSPIPSSDSLEEPVCEAPEETARSRGGPPLPPRKHALRPTASADPSSWYKLHQVVRCLV